MRTFVVLTAVAIVFTAISAGAEISDTTVATSQPDRIVLSPVQATQLGIEPKFIDIKNPMGLFELELKRPEQLEGHAFKYAEATIYQEQVAVASLASNDSQRLSFFYFNPGVISTVKIKLSYGKREYLVEYQVNGI